MKERSFLAKGVRSLVWRGDTLVDWVCGGRSFELSGAETRAKLGYRYRFDAAIASPDGRFVVIYERRGTKGLLLDSRGQIVRELNRSFYCAEVYEYPIAFLPGPNDGVLLAHCPKSYRQLEIEDVETGVPIAGARARSPSDFFHSRLEVSPGGKRLLSAGWVWHPWSEVLTFDLAQAYLDSRCLDRGAPPAPASTHEVGSACWLTDDLLAIGASAEVQSLGSEDDPIEGPRCRGVAAYDVAGGAWRGSFELGEPPGEMRALDNKRVLSLYRHPKVLDVTTGEVLHAWEHLNSGRQDSSIIGHLKDDAIPPPMAYNPKSKRFAIANGDAVTVLDLS